MPGAVAAPTAGLLFTPALFDACIVGSPAFGWGWKEIEPDVEKYFNDLASQGAES